MSLQTMVHVLFMIGSTCFFVACGISLWMQLTYYGTTSHTRRLSFLNTWI